MKLRKVLAGAFLAAAAATTSACSNADLAAWKNLGQEAHIKVYSGNTLVYEGVATGKIENEGHSDGYYFQDKCIPGDNKLAEVAGTVIITRDDLNCPAVREPVIAQMKAAAATAAAAPKAGK